MRTKWSLCCPTNDKQAWKDVSNMKNHSWASPDVSAYLRWECFFVFFRTAAWRGCSDSPFHDEFHSEEGDKKLREIIKANLIHMYKKLFAVWVDNITLDNLIQYTCCFGSRRKKKPYTTKQNMKEKQRFSWAAAQFVFLFYWSAKDTWWVTEENKGD